MATRFASFDGLGGIKSTWSTIMDTSLHFYDMQDFKRRLRTDPIQPIMEKLQGNKLVEATRFPIVVQALELIVERINHYN